MSNFNNTFRSNRSGQYNPLHEYKSQQSKKTSFSHAERTRFHEIGRELRTARGAQRARLMGELDRMSEGKEFTAADTRLVAVYAKSGAMQEQDGYAPGDGQRMLDMARTVTDE